MTGLTIVVMFVGGIGAFMTPLYQSYVKPTVAVWWGSHDEMVDPTYLLLVGVVPTLMCVVVTNWRRSLRFRCGTWKVATLLRRRPRADWMSYGEILFLLVLVSGNALVFWYVLTRRHHRPGPKPPQGSGDHPSPSVFSVRTIGHALGFNSVLNLVLLFLPATRNSAWLELLNISYANGIKYHRWLGVAAVLTGFVHGACYYYCWLGDGSWSQMALPCWDCSLRDRMGRKIWINVFGEIAALCFVLIGVTSIPWIRRHLFNLFYYVHQLLFVAVIFTVLHWAQALWFLLPAFVGYLISRVLSHCNGSTLANVVEFSALSPTLCKLVIAYSPSKRGRFTAGQFVYVNVPAISRLQWHAFTIASSPLTSPYSDTSTYNMVLIIKSLGDWTEKLLAYAQDSNVGPDVYLDGYYGASLSDIAAGYDMVALVGGGVGITPLVGLLEDMCVTAEQREMQGRLPFRQRVLCVLAMRELELMKEIYPLLTRIRELDPLGRFVTIHLTLTTTPRPEELDSLLYASRKGPVVSYSTLKPRAAQVSGLAFAVALGSTGTWMLQFVTFTIVVSAVFLLQFGDGVLIASLRDSVWVVKLTVKLLTVFGAAVCVYCGVTLTKWSRDTRVACNLSHSQYSVGSHEMKEHLLSQAPQVGATATGVVTFRDLISDLGVRVGTRPDLAVHLRQLRTQHQSKGNGPIGVLVSGPSSLKTATSEAIASIGAKDFDMHEEEFEL